jgi:flagellar biosynthesis protein FlhB
MSERYVTLGTINIMSTRKLARKLTKTCHMKLKIPNCVY